MAARSTARTPATKAPAKRSRAARGPEKTPPATILPLRGAPQALVGAVPVSNTGQQRQLLRAAVLHLDGHDPITVPMSVALRPGTATLAPVVIDLGPSWPPGEVTGELTVGDTRVAVTLDIEPSVRVELHPDTVLAEAGETTVAVRATNAGNVPIPLAAVTAGRLRDHDAGEPPPQASPARGPRAKTTVTAADQQVTATMPESLVLEPGTTRALTATLVVPTGLDPTRRHHALIPVGSADLTVIVLPVDPAAGPTR